MPQPDQAEKPVVCDVCRKSKTNWYGPCPHTKPPTTPSAAAMRAARRLDPGARSAHSIEMAARLIDEECGNAADLLAACQAVVKALDAAQVTPYIHNLDVNALRAAIAKHKATRPG